MTTEFLLTRKIVDCYGIWTSTSTPKAPKQAIELTLTWIFVYRAPSLANPLPSKTGSIWCKDGIKVVSRYKAETMGENIETWDRLNRIPNKRTGKSVFHYRAIGAQVRCYFVPFPPSQTHQSRDCPYYTRLSTQKRWTRFSTTTDLLGDVPVRLPSTMPDILWLSGQVSLDCPQR